MKSRRRRVPTLLVGLGVLLAVVAVVAGAALAMRPASVSNASELNASAANEASAVEIAREASAPLVAVFIGDSYAVGTGASGKPNRWSTLVARSQNWQEVNFAVGGTGYANHNEASGKLAYYEQAQKIGEAAVVVVSGGRNDAQLYRDNPAAVTEHVQDTFAKIRAAAPGARLIVLAPWTDDDQPEAGMTELAAVIQDAATSAGVEYLDTGQPLLGRPDFVAADGVHPNDAGYAALAAAVEAALAN